MRSTAEVRIILNKKHIVMPLGKFTPSRGRPAPDISAKVGRIGSKNFLTPWIIVPDPWRSTDADTVYHQTLD